MLHTTTLYVVLKNFSADFLRNHQKLNNEVQIENEVRTLRDVSQWKLIRDRELISNENLH